MGLVSLSFPQTSEIVDRAALQRPGARLNSTLKCLGQGVTHPVSVHMCQTVASQARCKFTQMHLSLLSLLRCMNRRVETHTGTVHPQPAPCGLPLARGMLPLCPLLHFISSGASELGTATPARCWTLLAGSPLAFCCCVTSG